MTIFEIAIDTRLGAADACGGVGCVVYGMFDDDLAPKYYLECQSARNLGSDSDLVQVTWGDTT